MCPNLKISRSCIKDIGSNVKSCRYVVTRETFPLTSHSWEEGDVHDQGLTRDTAQVTDTSTRRGDGTRRQNMPVFRGRKIQLLTLASSFSLVHSYPVILVGAWPKSERLPNYACFPPNPTFNWIKNNGWIGSDADVSQSLNRLIQLIHNPVDNSAPLDSYIHHRRIAPAGNPRGRLSFPPLPPYHGSSRAPFVYGGARRGISLA